jgi:hypothetical protein
MVTWLYLVATVVFLRLLSWGKCMYDIKVAVSVLSECYRVRQAEYIHIKKEVSLPHPVFFSWLVSVAWLSSSHMVLA